VRHPVLKRTIRELREAAAKQTQQAVRKLGPLATE